MRPTAAQIPTAVMKMRKAGGGLETNLLNLQIRRGSVSSPLRNRYDAIPMEEAMIAINAVSVKGDTGTSKACADVPSARNSMNPTFANAMKKPESRKYVFLARRMK
jgi:hypothetical protein